MSGALFFSLPFLFEARQPEQKPKFVRCEGCLSSCRLVLLMLSCSCLTRCFNRPALLEKTLRAKVNFFVLRGSCHLGSSRGLCLSVHNLELCLWRGSVSTPRHRDGILTRQNHLPKLRPSANVAQVQMSRGTLTCLSQTGEGFLLTFDLGRQDVNNKNNHGMG